VVLTPDAVRLDGRVAVVTGAAAGIGRACALALASFGADLAACDRDGPGLASLAEQVGQLGRKVLTYECDVRDQPAVARLAAATAERYDAVHVLVNNAGGGFRSSFADVSPKGDTVLVQENLLSVAWVTRAFLGLLAPGASVIAVTSVEAHRAAPGYAMYGAAKAGVAALVRSLAVELGEHGIRVNAVAPDLVPTPGVGPLTGATSPLGRVGDAAEVAGAVVFLAGGLSTFVTGSTVHVDGGTWAAGGWRRAEGGGWRT